MGEPCFHIFVAMLLLHFPLTCLAMTIPSITTDQSSLLALKSRISLHPDHILVNNWSASAPPSSVCNWIGVTCSTRHNRVAALDLPDMGLMGTISSHLGNLSFLVRLQIQNNSFHGDLPRELVQLHRLKFINLAVNNFGGEVPSWLGGFPKLQYLNLDNNSFSGPIPQEIGNLYDLKRLRIQYNQLTGPIPLTIFNISSLLTIAFTKNNISGNLPIDMCHRISKIEFVHLSFNELEGQIPSSLGECSELQILSLSVNKFTGPVPREIGYLTMLKLLYLGDNNLKGSIPSDLGNCTSINVLDLASNNLTGVLPEEIGSLWNLDILNLQSNGLTGPFPASVFNISRMKTISTCWNNYFSGNLPPTIGLMLPNLEILQLGLSGFNGNIPPSLSNASKLIILDLNDNKFTGSIPHSFGNLRFLEILSLTANKLTSESSSVAELGFITSLTNCRRLRLLEIGENPLNGILPSSIGNLSNSLEMLKASYCGIMGNIPNEISNLSSLIFLGLESNNLVGSLPMTLKRLGNLQILGIAINSLRGPIPDDLCHLQNLGYLSLWRNELSGPLSACLGNLTALRYLYLDSNNLTSYIPESLWTLRDILEIDLSSNSFSGYLPPEIGSFRAITLMNLSTNQLTGAIPTTIGGLQSLLTLSLAHNRFQGPVPQSFGKLISLEFSDLSQNNLSGVIPKSLEALSHLTYFNVSFNRLRGEIPSGGPFRNFTYQSFMWNEALCGASWLHVLPCPQGSTRHSRPKKIVMLVFISVGIAIVLIASTCAFVLFRCQRKNKIPTLTDMLPAITHGRIAHHELVRATNGFDGSNLLGTGSFSSVFKGVLTCGTLIAVKVFNLQLEGALKSFDRECEMLRNIRHRNLIRVISSCSNLDFKALVLEYISNGSLDKWLYSHNYFLDIKQRLDIMIDVACALDYLHNGYSISVVHCDLKPSNVLLDEDMVAHVSDFGISKFLREESIVQTNTLATIGYIAPEYGQEGLVSTRCDVYSFGIMLMEIVTRKKPFDEIFSGDLCLKKWVNESLPNGVIHVIDANLLRKDEEQYGAKVHCVSSILELALSCSTESPAERVNMKDVLVSLEKIRVNFLANLK